MQCRRTFQQQAVNSDTSTEHNRITAFSSTSFFLHTRFIDFHRFHNCSGKRFVTVCVLNSSQIETRAASFA